MLQRLKTWFHWWQSALTNNRTRKTGPKTSNILKKFLQTNVVRRVPSAIHKYSELFYPTCVALLVLSEVASLPHKPTAGENLIIIKHLTKQAWENEDNTTIAAVNATLDVDRAAKLAANSCEGAERTAAEYQMYVHSTPYI